MHAPTVPVRVRDGNSRENKNIRDKGEKRKVPGAIKTSCLQHTAQIVPDAGVVAHRGISIAHGGIAAAVVGICDRALKKREFNRAMIAEGKRRQLNNCSLAAQTRADCASGVERRRCVRHHTHR